jgi:hypothetical protein
MALQMPPRTYADDVAEIHQIALDYMQGWYESNAERMRQCLHPELAKRAILRDPQTGEERLSHLSQRCMVELTQQGGGRDDAPAHKRYYAITVLDICGDLACARAESYNYLDFLQLARSRGKCLIVNVLWTQNRDRATWKGEAS